MQAHETFCVAGQLIAKDASRALALFESSRDRFAQLGDECNAAIAEIWAAQMLRDVGKVLDARVRLAAIISNAEPKKFSVLLAPAYYWLAMNDYSQRRLSESAKNLRTGLRIAEGSHNVFEIQHAEDALAKHYAKLGERQPALIYAGKKFSDQSGYYQRDATQYWRDLATLAELTLKFDLQSASLSFATEALSFAEANSFDDARMNQSLRHVIESSLAFKDLNTSLRYANQSLAIANRNTDDAGAKTSKAEIYGLLGEINRAGKNCSEALGDYDQALELYGRLPQVTSGAYQIHKGKLDCFQQLNDDAQFVNELKLVMNLTEDYRQNIREDTSRQAFFDNQQEVFDAAIEHAIRNGDARAAFAYAEESRARSLLQFVESPKSIAEVESQFSTVARPLGLAELQARLPDQVQIVQYAVLPNRLAIWTITKTEFNFQQKQISSVDLEQRVLDYQTSIASNTSGADISRAGRDLYELLIPAGLSGEKQVCIIADKVLHQLAFATLVSGTGNYLLQDYVLSYAPSASILIVASENANRKASARSETVLSVGNPAFDRDENPNLPDLSEAESEARSIAETYPKSIRFFGADATRQSFLSNLDRAEIIHFAGHFVTNQQLPGNSKLLFADGDLRSAELESIKLPRAKLVVLSACETGFERYNRSEGSIGVARTFLALGAPVVLASQWKVDSTTTRDLMIAFHRRRRQLGMKSAESLRQAQLEVMSRKETSAPFFWAAFSLYGGYANY